MYLYCIVLIHTKYRTVGSKLLSYQQFLKTFHFVKEENKSFTKLHGKVETIQRLCTHIDILLFFAKSCFQETKFHCNWKTECIGSALVSVVQKDN